jgi:hypothetical protein
LDLRGNSSEKYPVLGSAKKANLTAIEFAVQHPVDGCPNRFRTLYRTLRELQFFGKTVAIPQRRCRDAMTYLGTFIVIVFSRPSVQSAHELKQSLSITLR